MGTAVHNITIVKNQAIYSFYFKWDCLGVTYNSLCNSWSSEGKIRSEWRGWYMMSSVLCWLVEEAMSTASSNSLLLDSGHCYIQAESKSENETRLCLLGILRIPLFPLKGVYHYDESALVLISCSKSSWVEEPVNAITWFAEP